MSEDPPPTEVVKPNIQSMTHSILWHILEAELEHEDTQSLLPELQELIFAQSLEETFKSWAELALPLCGPADLIVAQQCLFPGRVNSMHPYIYTQQIPPHSPKITKPSIGLPCINIVQSSSLQWDCS